MVPNIEQMYWVETIFRNQNARNQKSKQKPSLRRHQTFIIELIPNKIPQIIFTYIRPWSKTKIICYSEHSRFHFIRRKILKYRIFFNFLTPLPPTTCTSQQNNIFWVSVAPDNWFIQNRCLFFFFFAFFGNINFHFYCDPHGRNFIWKKEEPWKVTERFHWILSSL